MPSSSIFYFALHDGIDLETQPNYRISPAKSAGFIAINNAIMRPTANPMIVPAATPRVSILCSPVVILRSKKLLHLD